MDQRLDLVSLEGRVAVVTGAGRGIGAAVAALFARAGALVALLDRDAAGVTRSAEAIALAGGEALPFAMDITDAFAVERTMDVVMDEWGRLDVLVNNAGMRREAPLAELTDEDWAEVLDVNLRATMVCAQAAVPHMLVRGSGRILSAASAMAREARPDQTAYAAAKAGIIGMTRVWARELGPKGITANAVAPGFIESELGPPLRPEERALIEERLPARRLGTRQEVANVYLFLASDLAGFINGAVVGVDGGLHLY
jgi:3-oxoacyl-[acyl-carrier protein] reductase